MQVDPNTIDIKNNKNTGEIGQVVSDGGSRIGKMRLSRSFLYVEGLIKFIHLRQEGCSDGKHPTPPTLRLLVRVTKGTKKVGAPREG